MGDDLLVDNFVLPGALLLICVSVWAIAEWASAAVLVFLLSTMSAGYILLAKGYALLGILLFYGSILDVLALLALRAYVRVRGTRGGARTIMFYHPTPLGGGGGERVLWLAVRELLNLPSPSVLSSPASPSSSRLAQCRVVIAARAPVPTTEDCVAAVERNFGVTIPPTFTVVKAPLSVLGEAATWKVGTLFLQAIGQGVSLAAACVAHAPYAVFDTVGTAVCGLPMAKVVGVRTTATYVHYPLISYEMLASCAAVRGGAGGVGGPAGGGGDTSAPAAGTSAASGGAATATPAPTSRVHLRGMGKSVAFDTAKLAYYRAFAVLFSVVGRVGVDVVLANGSWSASQLRALWGGEAWADVHCGSTKPQGVGPRSGGVLSSVCVAAESRDAQTQRKNAARLSFPKGRGGGDGAGAPAEAAGATTRIFSTPSRVPIELLYPPCSTALAALPLRPTLSDCRRAAVAAGVPEGVVERFVRMGVEELVRGGKVGGSGRGSGEGGRGGAVNVEDCEVLPCRLPWVLSVAQFRPEKDHQMQLEALAELKRRRGGAFAGDDSGKRGGGGGGGCGVVLFMCGGVRCEEDEGRAAALEAQAKRLGVEDNVVVLRNIPWVALKALFSVCGVGVHTMWVEHFGIGVVEFLLSGVVCVGRRSGGPELDIVVPELTLGHSGGAGGGCSVEDGGVGFLADDPMEYADAIEAAVELTVEETEKV